MSFMNEAARSRDESASARRTGFSELVSRWPLLLGAMIGLGVGVNVLPSVAVTVFMRDLEHEFGWSRAVIGSGTTVQFIVLMLMAPVIGWISDRVSEVRIICASLLALSVGLFLFSRMDGAIWEFYAGYVLISSLGAGSATLAFARLISTYFDKARGAALGISLLGPGISHVLLPILVVPFGAEHGWRETYVALALVAVLATPLIYFLLNWPMRAGVPPAASASGDGAQGLEFKQALRTRAFWTLAFAFPLVAIATAGLMIHFISYLRDQHLSPHLVATYASLLGVVLMCSRVGTGFLIDRFFAPLVAAIMMSVSALCLVGLAFLGMPAALLGVIGVGLAFGAEVDLVGYMVAKYFGMKAYGRCYGILYATVLVGSALSSTLYGFIFDTSGAYIWAMLGGAALLAGSAVALTTLPRFPIFR